MFAFLRLVCFIAVLIICSVLVIIMPTKKLRLLSCQLWGRLSLAILGIRLQVKGKISTKLPFVIVANHFGFTEIIALMSIKGIRFVSKSELGRIPFLGWAMKRSEQVFICRSRGKAKEHLKDVQVALQEGDNLAIFPEGTTNDSYTLLPFKSTLLRIVEDEYKPCDFTIIPIAVRYGNLSDKQKELVSWKQEGIGTYLWKICRLGCVEMVADILQATDIIGTGHNAKVITANVETQITQAFEKLGK